MNAAVNTLYAEYLDHTGGDKAAAASLTLAAVMAETGGKTPPSTALTVAEAARRMNVTRQTVYQMCQSGRLRSFRPGTGRALRIPLEAIEQCENESGVREPAHRFPDIIKRTVRANPRRTALCRNGSHLPESDTEPSSSPRSSVPMHSS